MDVVSAVLAVFMAVASWIGEAMLALQPIFWTAGEGGSGGSLTWFGALSVFSLAFGVVFLLLGLVIGFLKFRTN